METLCIIPPYRVVNTLYANPLSGPDSVQDWIHEGQPQLDSSEGRLLLSNGLDPALGQASNFLFWCPRRFSGSLRIRWQFRPLREPGLAMFWWQADGREGRDLFDPTLPPRDGNYRHYHSGAINGYHLSYFRRKNPSERAFHTCNLRKSHGFHLVAQGADPIPDVSDVQAPFQMELLHLGRQICFSINQLPLLQWTDNGGETGPSLHAGYLGFRQMAPLLAEYAELTVEEIEAA